MDPRQVIQDLQDQVAQLRSEVQALHSRSARPKPALPDPERFNGQSHKFDTWLPSIKAKLRVDHAAIGDQIAQFYYVFLNLESHVQAMVLPQLSQAEETNLWDYQTILHQLARVFDNPNKVQEAEDKLLSLRQGSDSIPAFIAKFERVLYEARGQDWPDLNKISVFRNGLNPSIRSRLNQQLNLPSSYPNFVRVVQQLATRALPSNMQSHPVAPEPMEINAINAIEAFDAFEQPSSPSSPSASSASSVSSPHVAFVPPLLPRARSISPILRGQYRLQGRCVRCGSYDHWVDQCKLRSFKPQTAKRTGGIPASEVDSDSGYG